MFQRFSWVRTLRSPWVWRRQHAVLFANVAYPGRDLHGHHLEAVKIQVWSRRLGIIISIKTLHNALDLDSYTSIMLLNTYRLLCLYKILIYAKCCDHWLLISCVNALQANTHWHDFTLSETVRRRQWWFLMSTSRRDRHMWKSEKAFWYHPEHLSQSL